MKQTILPTSWEKIWYLHVRGVLLTLMILASFILLSVLLLTVFLQYTNLGEEQVPVIMPFLVFVVWFIGVVVGYALQKRHLLHSKYHFLNRKTKLAALGSQVYASILYFAIIALF